ncbi:hypothetical protein K7432_005030 [Basidiobolus ranarum]|uniref:Uncharacterized protein n=1 Tax=Basidiobolus ranarum TaxID=34480 RepID=A0ABR2WXC5_9FUNG
MIDGIGNSHGRIVGQVSAEKGKVLRKVDIISYLSSYCAFVRKRICDVDTKASQPKESPIIIPMLQEAWTARVPKTRSSSWGWFGTKSSSIKVSNSCPTEFLGG